MSGALVSVMHGPCVEAEVTNAEQPVTANVAKNLARLNCGAHIDRVLPGGNVEAVPVAMDNSDNPAALVLDDNTLSCPLPVGDSTFIITLSRIAVLQRFAFINQNASAQGEFELAVSNYRLGSHDPKWVSVQSGAAFTGKRLVTLPVLGMEARYVKLTFHVKKQGRLAGIALYGGRTLETFADRNILRAQTVYSMDALRLVTHPEDTLNFNYANEYARGQIVYVSSGQAPLALRMIDDDVATSFSFAARDPHPTVIVALANRQNLHRVSAVYEMQQGHLDVYLLDQLGSTPGDLNGAKAIGSINQEKGDGNAAVEFETHGARYVALQWTPTGTRSKALEVAEIAAFGSVPLSILNLEEVPNAFAENSKPGEGAPDLSNSLGTIAIPPSLPVVSP
jgi:hypothetical protein